MVVGADHPIQMSPPGHVAQLLQIWIIMKVGTHCKHSQTQADQLSQPSYQYNRSSSKMYSTTQKSSQRNVVLTPGKQKSPAAL